MKLRQSLALLLLLFAGIVSASAQIGTSVVNATGTFSVPPTDVITLKAQIVSCGAGQLPLYNGTPISLTPNQTPASPFTATNSGSAQSVSFTVPGNDGISCGGQNYSLYAITWYDNGFPLAPTQTFRFAEQTTQTLAQLAAVSFIPPVIVNSAGALCPAATPVFSGFDKNYHIICGVTGSIAAMPVVGGTFIGPVTFSQSSTFNASSTYNAPLVQTLINPLTVNYVALQVVNGIPQADQFAGADFCVKLRAAENYAITNHVTTVDATHFTGAQSCTVDPFIALATAGTTVPLTVLLPGVTIQFAFVNGLGNGLTVNNTGINLFGQGRFSTIFQYTGTAAAGYAFGTGALNNVNGAFQIFRDFSVLGNSHVINAITLQNWHRSSLENVSAWGATGCGIYMAGAVTDTLIKPHVSSFDAALANPVWSSLTTPSCGIGMDAFGGNQTTDGTVVDGAFEGITSGIGIKIISANSMTFTSGTSESNRQGITIASGSKWNSFIGEDIESNTLGAAGSDIADLGQSTFYQNVIAASGAGGGVSATFGGGGGQYILGEAGFATLWSGNVNILGVATDFSEAGTGSTTVNQLISKGNVKGTSIQVTNNVAQGVGLQTVSQTGCTFSAGAIGNFCTTAITLPVTEPDTNYSAVCSVSSTLTGMNTVGNIANTSTTVVTVNTVALSTAGAGGGLVNCTITHR